MSPKRILRVNIPFIVKLWFYFTETLKDNHYRINQYGYQQLTKLELVSFQNTKICIFILCEVVFK